jgi:superfamily II DNA/RNA helicase
MARDERDAVLQKLRSGSLDCIVQVQILGEGFDHPNLSVAAIFRPFRSLSPYVQFIGRIMRVIVQGDPTHPDNLGSVVSHIGMNTDALMDELRQLDRDDQEFFERLMNEVEPDLPERVTSGDARQRLNPAMAVHSEIVSSFLEDGFLDAGDEMALAELLKQAELLGLDTDAVAAAIRAKVSEGMRTTPATDPYPVTPQRRRIESRRRLREEVNSAAKIVLNRLSLRAGGFEIASGVGAVSGSNLVAAVQLLNRHLNDVMGWDTGGRAELSTDEIEAGMEALDGVLTDVTRLVAAKVKKIDREGESGKG